MFLKKIRIQVEEKKKKMVDGKWENSMKDEDIESGFLMRSEFALHSRLISFTTKKNPFVE